MPTSCTSPRPACHWEEIQGGRVRGRVVSSKVWVCEYPYRTMRRHEPGAECSDCPVWQERQAAKARDAEATEEEFIARSGV